MPSSFNTEERLMLRMALLEMHSSLIIPDLTVSISHETVRSDNYRIQIHMVKPRAFYICSTRYLTEEPVGLISLT